MTRAHLTPITSNKKLGPMPASYTESSTCPTSCVFRGNGCYAEAPPLSMFWSKVDSGQHGKDWVGFCEDIRALPARALWRHNVAGDLPGPGNEIETNEMAMLAAANSGKRGFTFTHKPPTMRNLHIVRGVNRQGFTINWSANNLAEADLLARADAGPVVAVVSSNWARDKPQRTSEGRVVAQCPATYREGVTCLSCQLCAAADRKVIIAFPAHGTRVKHVDKILEDR